MRVYVGSTLDALSSLRQKGFEAPVAAHAVTGALWESYAEADGDELEYAAMAAAAEDSLRALAAGGERWLRVVVAAEVPDRFVRPLPPGEDVPSSVVVSCDVARALVVSVHIDDADDTEAADDVRAAVTALPAADEGDDDAIFVVGGAEGRELLWYDVSEVDDLLDPPR